METYNRNYGVKAIQFFEKEYHKKPMKYISVIDKAMRSSIWHNKTAEDGRYYVLNQTNANPRSSIIEVGEGDYIIHDTGIHIVMSAECFEDAYSLETKNQNKYPVHCSRCEVYIRESNEEGGNTALCKECYYGKCKTLEASN